MTQLQKYSDFLISYEIPANYPCINIIPLNKRISRILLLNTEIIFVTFSNGFSTILDINL